MPIAKLSQIIWIGSLFTSAAFAGAWGLASFDNDDAMDWVASLEQADDLSVLDAAFSSVDPNSKYVEAPECSMALAAAEVVAAARGQPAKDLPAEAVAWLKRERPTIGPELVKRARNSVTFCRESENSELRQLWAESKQYQAWLKDTEQLLARLK